MTEREARSQNETRETYPEICHVRHGWIAAPEGYWFEEQGKSYWLCTRQDIPTNTRFPFGTRFNARSITAVVQPPVDIEDEGV